MKTVNAYAALKVDYDCIQIEPESVYKKERT